MTSPAPKKQAGKRRKRRKRSEQRPEKDQRTKTVGVRLSIAELAELAAQAKRLHKKKATVLRAAWLGKELPVPLPEVLGPAAPARVLTPAELAEYQRLLALATRLNELAELPEASEELRAEARALFTALRYLLADLVPPRTERK